MEALREKEQFNDAIKYIAEQEGKTAEQKARELKELVYRIGDTLIEKED